MPPRKKQEELPRKGTLLQAFGTESVAPTVDVVEEDAKPDFFAAIQNYFTKGRQITSKDDVPETYIQARFISMAGAGFAAATAYNRLAGRLPRWARPVVLYHLTPCLTRAPRMQYIKAAKVEESDAVKEVVGKLMVHYKCGIAHARQIYCELEEQNFDVYAFFGLKAPRGYGNGTNQEKGAGAVVKSKQVGPKKPPVRGGWAL